MTIRGGAPGPGAPYVIGVAVPVPGLGLLSYRAIASRPPVKGARVEVPVGSRTVIGCIVDPAASIPEGASLRDVRTLLDEEAFVPPGIVDLALWVAEYYASGIGDALALAMPTAARRRAHPFRTATVVDRVEDDAGIERVKGPRQREALEVLRQRGAGVRVSDLARQGVTRATLNGLARHGHVVFREAIVDRDPFATGGEAWSLTTTAGAPELMPEQSAVLEALTRPLEAGGFHVSLLHGVTGSGKTEVYLRLTARALARGRRALVLVPEIALTPALVGVFRARFGDRVAIQHSALSSGERHDQWHRVRRGDVDVVVGTRSAVFAPIDRLGLVIVDEEHESSYKQDEAPRYQGRDVAVMRARMEGAMVVLGSATPSLESAANAERGRYEIVRLTRRVLDRPLATVHVVDMRKEMAREGGSVTFSRPLLEALELRLQRGEQSLVLLNRRGFATVVFCRQCGASLECPHCSVNLTYHRGVRRLRCHYCNYAAPVPKHCGECGGEYLEQQGAGTERLQVELAERFPAARVVRVDRDTIRRRGAIAGVIRAVSRGEVDIVVGTQMIAKGHDFPAVTLVGVVSADVGLGLADFRAGERTFQLLTQVAGRAGRGRVAGEAIVQTLYPDHYSIRAAAAQDYALFYHRESEFRSAMGYPPAVSLINVVVKGRSIEAAMADAGDLAGRVRQREAGLVVGPAPAAVSKIKDEHRAHFFVKGRARRLMREAVEAAIEARPDVKRRTIVDVDPASVL